MTAARLLDSAAGENFKFLILEEMGEPIPASLFMALRLRDGRLELRHEEFDLPTIQLGVVGPLLRLPPRP